MKRLVIEHDTGKEVDFMAKFVAIKINRFLEDPGW
jgi:hypothetical protein